MFTNGDLFSQDSDLINDVINQLNLGKANIGYDYIVSKVIPNNTKETIIVIPRIVEEDEDYFELQGHIVIANNETGKIINTYIDRSTWTSDAVELSKITIDTAPYKISDTIRAFGIRTHYYSRSQPNPYSSTSMDLFIKSGNN